LIGHKFSPNGSGVAEAAEGDLDEAQWSRQPHVRQSLAWQL